MIERVLSTFAIAVVSIWLHELGHARAAVDFGDPLGARRWSWRPFVNLDPLFSLIVPLASSLLSGGAFVAGMGRPFLLQRANWRIIAAGPLVNLGLFFVFAAFDEWHWASVNLGLFIFNLLPIRPFDGWAIIACYRMAQKGRRAREEREAVGVLGPSPRGHRGDDITDAEAQEAVLGFTIPPEK